MLVTHDPLTVRVNEPNVTGAGATRQLTRIRTHTQIFAISETDGAVEKVAELVSRPSYKELEELLKAREGSIAQQGPMARVMAELKFNADTLQAPKPPSDE